MAYRPLHSARSSPRSSSPFLHHLVTYSKVHRATSRSRAGSVHLSQVEDAGRKGMVVKGRPVSGEVGRKVDKAVRRI